MVTYKLRHGQAKKGGQQRVRFVASPLEMRLLASKQASAHARPAPRRVAAAGRPSPTLACGAALFCAAALLYSCADASAAAFASASAFFLAAISALSLAALAAFSAAACSRRWRSCGLTS